MFFMSREKSQMVPRDQALPGRGTPIATATTHFVTGRPLQAVPEAGLQEAMFGMGCFWGVERMFWGIDGVWVTMVGYAAGYTPNPTYEEVCSGKTGHNEVVRVIFDPSRVTYETLLKIFWEGHDPTQGMRQGNDRGTQYRSGIYTYGAEQAQAAQASLTFLQSSCGPLALARLPVKFCPRPCFTMPRIIISNIWRKIPTVIAA